MIGAAYAGTRERLDNLLTFDMGGTSTDVALVVDGEAQTTTSSIVAGIPIRHAMVDVHTVERRRRIDRLGGRRRRAPRRPTLGRRAARPGFVRPRRHGRHRHRRRLYLGYLAEGARLGGEIVLQHAPAEDAVAAVGGPAWAQSSQAAVGVTTVAEAEMVRALRVISIERGVDPRDFTLVAFGGAGGMHACRLAEELRDRDRARHRVQAVC